MNIMEIDKRIQNYVNNQEIDGGSLIVRQSGEIVYRNKWGNVEYDSIFRMMSMTKPVIAVGILKLMEQGKLSIDDSLAKYIPAFADMQVVADKRYEFHEGMNMLSLLPKILFFRMDKIHTEPAKRQVMIRDLLSHSSGLEQGVAGMIAMMRDKNVRESLEQQAEKYSKYPLDFQPGTGTGYSPLAGFDMLTMVIEKVSGMPAEEFLKKEIFEPLEMKDTTFFLSAEQEKRLVKAYKRVGKKLKDVTNMKEDMDGMLHRGKEYVAGCGGLYSTLDDYDHLAWMLCNKGVYKGTQFLRTETVELMHTEAPENHLEPEAGFVWGLGVKIRQNPAIAKECYATAGTYGWSGAFGTHFFISPKDDLEVVWLTNRTDLGGSGSYISQEIERLVFEKEKNNL